MKCACSQVFFFFSLCELKKKLETLQLLTLHTLAGRGGRGDGLLVVAGRHQLLSQATLCQLFDVHYEACNMKKNGFMQVAWHILAHTLLLKEELRSAVVIGCLLYSSNDFLSCSEPSSASPSHSVVHQMLRHAYGFDEAALKKLANLSLRGGKIFRCGLEGQPLLRMFSLMTAAVKFGLAKEKMLNSVIWKRAGQGPASPHHFPRYWLTHEKCRKNTRACRVPLSPWAERSRSSIFVSFSLHLAVRRDSLGVFSGVVPSANQQSLPALDTFPRSCWEGEWTLSWIYFTCAQWKEPPV